MTEAAVPVRGVGEWALVSRLDYENPFVDVALDAEFVAPSGAVLTVPGFYDGDGTWRVRFSPGETGSWRYKFRSTPVDAELTRDGSFDVTPSDAGDSGDSRGFLRATPGEAWGFHYESGEPVFLLGDTIYNLLAETFVGNDIRPYLARRAEQGFNLLRMSLFAMPFCAPNAYAAWSDRLIWPWGGDDKSPRFDRFDLEYFRAVDRTVNLVGEAGLGIEMIMEFSIADSPFYRRDLFTGEWEELWLRYLVARYDAYSCVYFWNLCNEYELVTGETEYKPDLDRWAIRTARLAKGLACHGHPVAVHNRFELPPVAERFAADPDAIDVVLYQVWGTTGQNDAWLAAGIEDTIAIALNGWGGSAMQAEYGYETAAELRHIVPIHQWLDADHTRRGAWRSAFCGLGVTAGFHQTWWGFGDYDKDQAGLPSLLHLRRFLLDIVSFADLRPTHDLVVEGPTGKGHRPLVLADQDRRTVAAYLPVGGEVSLSVASGQYRWYDPRSGELGAVADWNGMAKSPIGGGDRPDDWVLVITQ